MAISVEHPSLHSFVFVMVNLRIWLEYGSLTMKLYGSAKCAFNKLSVTLYILFLNQLNAQDNMKSSGATEKGKVS